MNHKNRLLLSAILLNSSFNYCVKNNNKPKLENLDLFDQLPAEMNEKILSYLNCKDLKNFRLACKLFKIISEEIFKKQKEIANKLGLELINSILSAKISIIIGIINSGNANINIRDKDGETALIWASKKELKNIVELLIKAGAKLNITDIWGNTALMHACHDGYLEIVELLIESGAKLNIQDDWGDTALISACDEGHAEIVKLLIKAGADIYIKNEDGKTALNFTNNKDIKNIILDTMNKKQK